MTNTCTVPPFLILLLFILQRMSHEETLYFREVCLELHAVNTCISDICKSANEAMLLSNITYIEGTSSLHLSTIAGIFGGW